MSDHLSHGFCWKKAALLTAGAYIHLHLGSCSMVFSLLGSGRGRHSGERAHLCSHLDSRIFVRKAASHAGQQAAQYLRCVNNRVSSCSEPEEEALSQASSRKEAHEGDPALHQLCLAWTCS